MIEPPANDYFANHARARQFPWTLYHRPLERDLGRFLRAVADEHPAGEVTPYPHATTTTEVVPLSRIASVALTTTVANPAEYAPGGSYREATLVVGWGAISHLDLEPATCGDENCEADHGYSGTLTADDLSLRVSQDGDGAPVVAQAIRFATVLSEAAARART